MPELIRITPITPIEGDAVVLRLEGWLTAAGVRVLEEEGRRWLTRCRRLVLDLGGVRRVDRAGLALLKRWTQTQQVLLRGATPFVRLLMAHHGLDTEEEVR